MGRGHIEEIEHLQRIGVPVSAKYEPSSARYAKAMEYQAGTTRKQLQWEKTTTTFDFLKKILVPSVLAWIFLGPGVLIGVLKILGQVGWVWFLIFIFIGLWLWRK